MDYPLGTHDSEIARLGIQHRAWRPRVLDLWQRAGFKEGDTLIDVGCGPGYAALDLADIAGRTGTVVAVDRSRRFLDALGEAARHRGVTRIDACEIDLDSTALPPVVADGAWCRWVLAFLSRPRAAIERLAAHLRPGARFALHEYFDCATWRTSPPCPELEEFVRAVMQSWRASGGEPDVGLHLPRWLAEAGFHVRELRPIVEIVSSTNPLWLWLKTFVEDGPAALCARGFLNADRAERIWRQFLALEAVPGTLMITPGVLEIVAIKE